MQTTPDTAKPATQPKAAEIGVSGTLPVEFIEFGLGLEMLLETHPVFIDAVKAALLPLDGEFLFELPQSGNPDGKGRIAAIRLAYGGSVEHRLVFAVLSDDGLESSIHTADGQPPHLTRFAQSFVDVIERLETVATH